MKLILTQILVFLSIGLNAQFDTITIKHIDLCPNLYKDVKVDSTYANFYVVEHKDTIYFNNLRCVMLHQLTTPGTIIWYTKKGLAHGFLEYKYETSSGRVKLSGNFRSGYFTNGNEVRYYTNGEIKCLGQYSNGQRIGIWKWYTENREFDFKCEFIDGICVEL